MWRKSELVLGPVVGQGGQGTVYGLQGELADHVYKQYWSPVNGDALERLVALPGILTETDRLRLLSQAAWPLAIVFDEDRVSGFIMHRVPQQFWARTSAGTRLRELQYLLYPRKPLWGEISAPEVECRVEIARTTVELFQLLQSRDLIVGDVSMRNLLWSTSPVGIYMLDCDSIFHVASPPVLPVRQTVDWDDPLQGADEPDLDTDRYKLALIVARVLTQNPTLRPGDALDFVAGVPDRIVRKVAARFVEARGPKGTRPNAGDWRAALGDGELPKAPAGTDADGQPTVLTQVDDCRT